MPLKFNGTEIGTLKMGTTEINTTKFGSTDVFSPGAQFDKTSYNMPNVSDYSTTNYGYIEDFVMVKNILYGVRIGQIDMKTVSNAKTRVLCFYKFTKNTCTLLQSWILDTDFSYYNASGGYASYERSDAKLYASGDYIYIFASCNGPVSNNGYVTGVEYKEIKFHHVRYSIKSNSFTTLSTTAYSTPNGVGVMNYVPELYIDRYNGYLTVYINFGFENISSSRKFLYTATSSNISIGTRYVYGDTARTSTLGKYCYKIIFNSDITAVSSKEDITPLELTTDKFINIGTRSQLPTSGVIVEWSGRIVTEVTASISSSSLSTITRFNIDNGQLAFLEVPDNSLEINNPLFTANVHTYKRTTQGKITDERRYQFTDYTESSSTGDGVVKGCITSIDSSVKIYTNGTKNPTLTSYAQIAFDDNSTSDVFYNDGKYIVVSKTKREAVLIKNGSVLKRFNLHSSSYTRLIADSGNNVFQLYASSGCVYVYKLEEITS